ncbi:hypothetical protein NDU88_003464, partial [Pleurodeles waltl]
KSTQIAESKKKVVVSSHLLIQLSARNQNGLKRHSSQETRTKQDDADSFLKSV